MSWQNTCNNEESVHHENKKTFVNNEFFILMLFNLRNHDILAGMKSANKTCIEQFCWIYKSSIVCSLLNFIVMYIVIVMWYVVSHFY